MTVRVRKIQVGVEETLHEGGPVAQTPLRMGYAAAVVENPFAGRYEPNILPFMDDLKPLGLALAGRLLSALGGAADEIEGYGKGAIVGVDGELEHGALWHAPGGYAMRELLGEAKAIVPSSKKVADVGARLDIPITHRTASYVRSHFNAMEVGLADAPWANELIVILVMTTGARVHARAGGLQASEIEGLDGLR